MLDSGVDHICCWEWSYVSLVQHMIISKPQGVKDRICASQKTLVVTFQALPSVP